MSFMNSLLFACNVYQVNFFKGEQGNCCLWTSEFPFQAFCNHSLSYYVFLPPPRFLLQAAIQVPSIQSRNSPCQISNTNWPVILSSCIYSVSKVERRNTSEYHDCHYEMFHSCALTNCSEPSAMYGIIKRTSLMHHLMT